MNWGKFIKALARGVGVGAEVYGDIRGGPTGAIVKKGGQALENVLDKAEDKKGSEVDAKQK